MATTVDGIPVGGSAGKITYARNRYGAYTRRRTKGVNPNSVRQSNVRGLFRAAVVAWFNDLSPAEREQWNTYAGATPWLNRAGESTFLSGQAAFIRQYVGVVDGSPLGANLMQAKLVPSVPSTGSINITFVSLIYDISDSEWLLTLTHPVEQNSWNDGNGGGFSFLSIAISEPMSPGRTFRPNRFRKLISLTSPTPAVHQTVDEDVTSVLPFALDTAGGQHVWFRFRGYSSDDKLLSVEQYVGPILTASQA
jgi:hypothetical protein